MTPTRATDSGLLPVSPSQTIGPFFHDVVVLTGSTEVAGDDAAGERVRIEGRVLDGAGEPVDDALIEIWQPHVVSGQSGPAAGFARSETVEYGRFSLGAFKPGRTTPDVPGATPFIPVRVFARGLLRSLVTRIYFEDESNAEDPVLQAVEPTRRDTLIARRDDSTDPPTYRLDIHLQGDRETVFFELEVDPS